MGLHPWRTFPLYLWFLISVFQSETYLVSKHLHIYYIFCTFNRKVLEYIPCNSLTFHLCSILYHSILHVFERQARRGKKIQGLDEDCYWTTCVVPLIGYSSFTVRNCAFTRGEIYYNVDKTKTNIFVSTTLTYVYWFM